MAVSLSQQRAFEYNNIRILFYTKELVFLLSESAELFCLDVVFNEPDPCEDFDEAPGGCSNDNMFIMEAAFRAVYVEYHTHM